MIGSFSAATTSVNGGISKPTRAKTTTKRLNRRMMRSFQRCCAASPVAGSPVGRQTVFNGAPRALNRLTRYHIAPLAPDEDFPAPTDSPHGFGASCHTVPVLKHPSPHARL